MENLQGYSSDEDTTFNNNDNIINLPMITQSSFLKTINATPEVTIKESMMTHMKVDPHCMELMVNPRCDQFVQMTGPANPFKSLKELAKKNTLTGFVEYTNLDNFNFENQRRTINRDTVVIKDVEPTTEETIPKRTVFENGPKRVGDKRKRESNYDATDIEGYTGPWAKFVDEKTIAVPSDEQKIIFEEFLAKRAKKYQKQVVNEFEPIESKSSLHVEHELDYQGRSFMLPPLSIDNVNFKSDQLPTKCFVPKKQVHVWTNAHRQGVSVLRLFPNSGHLMLTGGMDKSVKLWELYNERRLIRSYFGHREAIKDLAFNNDGAQFLTASYDKYIKLWDTETGQCPAQFTNKHIANVVKFFPGNNNLFLAGCQNKKILCYDVRSGETVQLYERHMGSVNSITFFDGNKRFVSTSDDRSLRMWEWDIPVDYRVLADPSMHSMPSVSISRNSKWLVCQSLDNQIVTYNLDAGFKKTKKVFRNQVAAGAACQIDFSPDMKYLISGDGEGKIYVWDFKTSKSVENWQGHGKATTACAWLPHETSKVVTAGWDGNIKLWD